MSTVVVVGNPKPRSRTYQAAHLVAERLTGGPPDLSVDLADLGPALLDWSDAQVASLVAEVRASDLAVFASPTYKATYTGLLKLFLDRIAGGALWRDRGAGDARWRLAALAGRRPAAEAGPGGARRYLPDPRPVPHRVGI